MSFMKLHVPDYKKASIAFYSEDNYKEKYIKRSVKKLYLTACLGILTMICRCSSSEGEMGNINISDNGYISSTPSFEDDFTALNTSVWQVAIWQEESLTSPSRCYVDNGILKLVFRYEPSSSPQYLGAALQTYDTFLYGRWEARLKPSSAAGVLNSMFTIDWDNMSTATSADGTKQEIDIEFLTKSFGAGSGRVHYALHDQDHKNAAATNPDILLGFNPSDDFHVYGFEITPQHVQWIVDGSVMYTYTYSGNPVAINSQYQLKFNTYTSVNWVGGPPAANSDCIYQIDWVRFYPYVSNR